MSDEGFRVRALKDGVRQIRKIAGVKIGEEDDITCSVMISAPPEPFKRLVRYLHNTAIGIIDPEADSAPAVKAAIRSCTY